MGKKNRLVKIMITLLVTMALILGMLPAAFAEELIESLPTPSPTPTTTVEEGAAEDSKPDTEAPTPTAPASTSEVAQPENNTEPQLVTPGVAGDEGENEPAANGGISTYAVNDSKYLKQGVKPKGTTINLFDYWIKEQNSPDNENPTPIEQGINQNHQLEFRRGNGEELANQWTGTASPRTGIVQQKLNEKNYPVTKDGNGISGNESLEYLFNPKVEHSGKESYSDVGNLLQVDGDGYYYYDSTKNFAEFDSETNNFILYNTWGVEAGGESKVNGQFFPFNKGSQVFTESGNTITQNGIKSTNTAINHYFGMTMSTRFIQQNEGYVDKDRSKEVTYEFSGDDDVWIFIDGVLVGDLGGIHDAASIKINFATGIITINDTESPTKLGELMGLQTDTLPDNTYHTLDFFYLERGNVDSNMKLKYNLVTIPESDIIKTDQDGLPLSGVTFDLYKADEKYNNTSSDLICTATTDATGRVVLMKDDFPISFNDLYEQGIHYMVLKEKKIPDGYRSSGDIKLYFYSPSKDSKNVALLSQDYNQTGAYASSRITASTGSTIKEYNGVGEYDLKNGGTLFAVPMKYVENGSDLENKNNWKPVYGNALDGWTTLESSSMNNIIEAAQHAFNPFILSSTGAYEMTIDELPGDIKTYYYMLPNDEKGKVKYTVGYFYLKPGVNIENAKAEDVVRVNSDTFDRVFSAHIYVPNIKNYLLVQKYDQNGNVVPATKGSAIFTLYSADQVTEANGVVTPDKPDKYYDQVQTADLKGETEAGVNLPAMNGTAIFPSDGKVLEKGVYYLKETTAPDGYEINDTYVKVIVDESGVYADAGTMEDNIAVTRGVGQVVYSMGQFAVDDGIDTTLHDIKASLLKGSVDNDNTFTKENENAKIGDGPQNPIHLQYSTNDAVLQYGPQQQGGPVALTTKTGWSWMKVEQCYDGNHGDPSTKQDWRTLDLTGLYSGTCIVEVTDNKVDELSITKEVTGAYGDTTKDFNFTVKITDKNDQAVTTGTYAYKKYKGETAEDPTGTATIGTDGMMRFDRQENLTLKHGEKIVISGLQVGWKAEIAEVFESDDKDGYTVNWSGGNIKTPTQNTKVTETIDEDGNQVTCTNDKTYVPPTGQSFDNPGMWAVLTAGVVLAMVLVALGVWRHKRTQN